MSTIFRVDLHCSLMSYKADPSKCVFGGEKNVLKTLEDTKKQKALIKNSLLTTKRPGKADNKSRGNRGKKPAAGGTKPKGKGKGAKKKAGLNPNLRLPPMTTRTRRHLPLRGRALMNLVSLFPIFLCLIIPSILSCASVEPVWTILLPPSLGVLIGQSAFLHSLPQSMYLHWV